MCQRLSRSVHASQPRRVLAQAPFIELREARGKTWSASNAKLLELQRLAGQSIGITEPARVRG
jgi:hypothetical protein